MAKIQTNCPRCKTPAIADVEQLFDLGVDPGAKQRLLSGQVNVIHCPNCGYDGMVGTPVVYHDPDKELLLTFVPPELGMAVNDQERMIGPLINQVVNRLPFEKRKAYILRPQSMFTFQTMIERILEADGITKQMIEDQQNRLNLLQRILSIPQAESRVEIIKAEEALIDQSFFAMLARLMEATLAQGDERTTRALAAIQQELVTLTKTGQEIQKQSQEAQEAMQALQEASKDGMTREKLLEMIIGAVDNEIRLSTFVGMMRNGLDYQFFQLLSEKIDSSDGDQKPKLEKLRERLLEYTKKMDEQVQVQMEQSRKLLNQILMAGNIEAATEENLQNIDEFFVEALEQELKKARSNADLDRIARLQKVNSVLEKASTPPAELVFIEELLGMKSYDERSEAMKAKSDMVTPEFLQLLSGLISQTEAQGQPAELVNALKEINRIALRISMTSAMTG